MIKSYKLIPACLQMKLHAAVSDLLGVTTGTNTENEKVFFFFFFATKHKTHSLTVQTIFAIIAKAPTSYSP